MTWKTSATGHKYRTGDSVLLSEIKQKIIGLSGSDIIAIIAIFLVFILILSSLLRSSDFEVCSESCEKQGLAIKRYNDIEKTCECQIGKQK